MSQYDVRFNNVSIRDASGAIQIVDISEITPKEEKKTVAMGLSHGSRLLRRIRESLSVKVEFAIRENDFERRAAAYDRVISWAKGVGELSISDRIGQILHVDSSEFPTMGSVKGWAGNITATFTAYARPFWESAFPAIASIPTAASVGTASILPPGNEDECFLDAEITATEAVNTLSITTGASEMSFSSLGLAKGQTLIIDHTDDGFLRMRKGEISVMEKRTEASSDELIVIPGKLNTVKFTANGACTATFHTRGRWR